MNDRTMQNNKEILDFWKTSKIFEKSLKGVKDTTILGKIKQNIFGHKYYTFYDGPPFANGLPHYGHVLQSIIKDVVPRYQTMKGNIVLRKWGWDCHGLPVEVEVEKELGLKSKKDVEKYGIGKFNQKARSSVLKYADEWKEFVPKIGRWVDMEKDYKTMDTKYSESVWYIFWQLSKNGYVKEALDARHICPRCETIVANHEISMGGYRDTLDRSVYVKLPLRDDLNTSVVIWTTTAWTLPGNTAAAVNKDIEYVKIKKGNQILIVAESKKDLIEGEVLEKIKGSELIGLKYIPPFNYYYESENETSWKIYHADYVSDDDGTGIVHLAPAYGADDLKLAEDNKIKIIHHVGKDGYFTPNISCFDKICVKSKNSSTALDDQVIEKLKEEGLLLKSEDITHSYPYCWRCDTPLLNYATFAWIIDVPKFKNILIKENQKINWIPQNIKDGRFGKWISDTKQWAVGRSRFWGTPLPIWRCKENGKTIIINSVKDMIRYLPKQTNEYLFIRHGYSHSNEKGVYCYESCGGLTEKGKEQIKNSAKKIQKEIIKKEDVIIVASPIKRTLQSSEILADILGISKEKIIIENGLKEIKYAGSENKSVNDVIKTKINALKEDLMIGYKYKEDGCESYQDVTSRMLLVLDQYSKKYKNKKIIFVSHQTPISNLKNMIVKLNDLDVAKSFYLQHKSNKLIKNAEITKIQYQGLPINDFGNIDLHRPYIDKIILTDKNKNKYENIKEVFDCWFESGSMPYGSHGYPFLDKKIFNPRKNKGFPADFISEGVDQTRGWFYTLHAISSGVFKQKSYNNVISTGLIHSKDGKKMSKKLKNYTDPNELIDTIGADALRYYLVSSPLTRGENLSFSDDGVKEIDRKIFARLKNCLTFYDTYRNLKHSKKIQPTNVLDVWIINKLNKTHTEMTKHLDKYMLDKAFKPLAELVEDISTWYLRRSRDRLKKQDECGNQARTIMKFVLIETTKLMAPIGPFTAETIYQLLKNQNEPESVHLCFWGKPKKYVKKILEDMESTRKIVSDVLEIRQKENIKVRQPLQSLCIKETKRLSKNHLDIIAQEVNVKEVVEDKTIKEFVKLDTKLTDQLKEEGETRELIRSIQNHRKKAGCMSVDMVAVCIGADESTIKLIEKNKENIKKSALISKLNTEKADTFFIKIG